MAHTSKINLGVNSKVKRSLTQSRDAGDGAGAEAATIAVTLNNASFEFAKRLVMAGKVVVDERDDWSEHQPSTRDENGFLAEQGFDEYARWHLGIDDQAGEDTKARYKFPYGDFERVHRCGVLAAESRAAQRKYLDIELAAAHLHGMLDASQRVKGASDGA